MEEYMKKLSAESQLFSNIVQGHLWLNKYSPKNMDKIFFPFVSYFFDAFEVWNVLGSYAGEQEFGDTYGGPGCLPSQLVANTENISILSICHAKNLKQMGNKKVF